MLRQVADRACYTPHWGRGVLCALLYEVSDGVCLLFILIACSCMHWYLALVSV